MSEWTYVRGSLELDSSPFEVSKDFNLQEPKRKNYTSDEEFEKAKDEFLEAYHKAIYLPFPKEQFKLGAPVLGWEYDTTKKKRKNEFGIKTYPEKSCIKFDGTVIYSLPRAKPIIEEAFKLFPQGELGFRYTLDQIAEDGTSSSSGFTHECLYKYYQDAINEMYNNFSHAWKSSSWNYEDLEKYGGVQDSCCYECVSPIICCINTALRWATANDVYDSLIKFMNYLEGHEIEVTNGYIEWQDSYSQSEGYRYAFRTGAWNGEYMIMKLDFNTNKIIWKRKHIHPTRNGKTNFDSFVDIEEEIKD